MPRTALAVFSKTPESKQAKTRLRTGSFEEAKIQELHRNFVSGILQEISKVTDCNLFAFWLPDDQNTDISSFEEIHPFIKHYLQHGFSFSERFRHMIQSLRELQYQQFIIVGSDCPKLTAECMNKAKDLLNSGHSVYGPAQRGGIYLLGFQSNSADVDWESLFAEQDQHRAFERSFPAAIALPPLEDVDLIEDLERMSTIL